MPLMFSARRLAAIAIAFLVGSASAEEKRPNLLIIRVHTRTLESAVFQDFTPQAASLEGCQVLGNWADESASQLSGCDRFRATGGREFIRPEVPLLSEAFKSAGYHTAFLGEWVLGDSLPFRPEDRCFMEVLVSAGRSTSDRWGNREQDPWLRDRSGWKQFNGNLSDVLAAESVKWLTTRVGAPEPFYLQLDLPRSAAGAVGRVLPELKRLNLESGTVTMLMVEAHPDVHSDLIARHEVFIRWPGRIPAGKSIEGQTAACDLFPTLASLCRVPMFRDWKGDGIDLSKWLLGDSSPLPERTFIQWGGFPRSESPDRYKAKDFAVLSPQWRLDGLELINLQTKQRGEFEGHERIVSDLLSRHGSWWQSIRPALVDPARMIVGDDRQKVVPLTWGDWWPSRESTDAKGQETYPNQAALSKLLETLADPEKSKSLPSISGHWKLHANQSGHYRVTLRKIPAEASEEERTRLGQFQAGVIHVRAGKFEIKTPLLKGATSVSLGVDLNEGPIELEAWTEGQTGEGKILGAFFASVERVGDRKMPDPEWKVRPK